MRKLAFLMLAWINLGWLNAAVAGNFSVDFHGGLPFLSESQSTQDLVVSPGFENHYTIKTKSDLFSGVGIAYKALSTTLGELSLGANLSYMRFRISGINSPLWNYGTSFDTLNYTAHGAVMALMIETKFVFTQHSWCLWQPYVLAGMGVSNNRVSDYEEFPTDMNSSARPTAHPFGDHTTTQLAYEVGVGVQHILSQKMENFLFTLDYRYMGLGRTSLGNNGVTNADFNLGYLSNNVVSAGLIWQI